ncbi:sodium-coupled monocarboxylate transporter 1-like [Scylla paramamosain]|uniref:sodium-coupled monocarboxylate transporter 1-like n=1 Tax=Scylla paramamosain TaxID=85552 RepID=UPI0030834EDB
MTDTTETSVPFGALEEARFTVLDYCLFSLMLVMSIGIGVYSAIKSRGRESTHDFLVGRGSMPVIPVALSLLGGVISAISMLGNPTEVYLYGTQIAGNLIGLIPGCILIHQLILPIFYGLRIVSLTQYVELRYKSRELRLLATVCNLLNKFFYMGICLYAPSLALSTVTKLSTWVSMVIMGSICTFYITVGGVKAVVYTDVMQTLLMFIGLIVVIVVCCLDLGGFSNVWAAADEGGRLEFFNMNPSPFIRHTFWSTSVLGFYFMINKVGLYQPCYQRFSSVGTLKMAQGLVISFVVMLYVLWLLCFFAGLVAYATYQDCDPITSNRVQKPDQILPYLVMEKLTRLPGMPGVFVAAVYGGVLSSLSSCGNSIACLIWEDFLKDRPYFKKLTDKAATNVVKLISALAGISGIFLGILAGKMGNIIHVTRSVSGSIMGPMQGVFIAGTTMPWVNAKGAVVGFLVSFSYNITVVLGKFIRGGGKPPRLPLSVDGCPENLVNATFASYLTSTSIPNTLVENTSFVETLFDTGGQVDSMQLTTPDPAQTSTGNTVYDISYTLFGASGILITMVVSSIVSLCTKPLAPGEVDERLLSSSSVKIYRLLWQFFKGSKISLPNNQQESEVSLKMISDCSDNKPHPPPNETHLE